MSHLPQFDLDLGEADRRLDCLPSADTYVLVVGPYHWRKLHQHGVYEF